MFKQKLQELCQQRQWALPQYTSAKDGPDHNPRFMASVTVNGVTFDGPQDAPSRTSKEAQNEAARVALSHFAPSAATPLPRVAMTAAPEPAQPSCFSSASTEVDNNLARHEVLKAHESDIKSFTVDAREMQYIYKGQLQNYCRKRDLNLPTYRHIHEGSLRSARFKAVVTVDGQTFESPESFTTLKDAEHAVARVALMSLSTAGNQEEEHGFYKSLLQELAQKEGLTLPCYSTVRDGPSHMPTFFSIVEIEGERFEGSVAKTRKQAEANAAKVAWTRLKERKLSRLPGGFSSRFRVLNMNDAFSILPLMDSQPDQRAESKGEPIDAHLVSSLTNDGRAHVTEHVGAIGDGNSTSCLKLNPTEEWQPSSSLSCDAPYAWSRDPSLDKPASSDDEMLSASECLSSPSVDGESVEPKGSGVDSLLCNRVRIYPRKPDFQLPPGTKLLPFSDEMWVAVSVEPTSEVAGSISV